MQQSLVDERTGAALAVVERLAVAEAAVYAQQARALHEAARLARLAERDGLERFVVLDLAGTLRLGQLGAGNRLADAERLVEVLPATLAALADGRLLVPQARVVLEETGSCTEEVAALVEQRLLALGGVDGSLLAGWTSGRLRRRLRQLVLAAEAELQVAETERRLTRARGGRRVVVRPEPDGMASLWALLPAEGARAFALGLDELVRRQRLADRASGLERTADQRRADVLASLPALALHAQDGTAPPAAAGVPDGGTGGLVAHPAVVLQVQVPVATALGLSHAPGELTGYGPVSAAQVRLLLPSASLQRVLVDEVTGEPQHADPVAARRASASRAATPDGLREQLRSMLLRAPVTVVDRVEPQHDPSARLDREARRREPLCTGPGCSVSSARCDLDHLEPWPAGPTARWNLGPKSRRCHRAKTFSWTVRRHDDGSHTWRSPTGRRYVVPPPWLPPPTALARRPHPPGPPPLLPAPDEVGVEGRPLADDLILPQALPRALPPVAALSWPDDPGF